MIRHMDELAASRYVEFAGIPFDNEAFITDDRFVFGKIEIRWRDMEVQESGPGIVDGGKLVSQVFLD